MDAAREFLKDCNRDHHEKNPSISEAENKAIENCVFQHKSILIGNKTLKDTVLPRQHWTLKQASRAGCSCCGPDPYEQMEEEEGNEESVVKTNAVDMRVPGGFTAVLNNENGVVGNSAPTKSTPGYVDGKMGFAFDPTKFS